MKIMDRLDNYLYDREYKIIIKENYLNVINYSEIVEFSTTRISIKCKRNIITIDGLNLVIAKMIDNEILVTGNISNVSIN